MTLRGFSKKKLRVRYLGIKVFHVQTEQAFLDFWGVACGGATPTQVALKVLVKQG